MYSSGCPPVYNCQNNLKDIFPLQLNFEQSTFCEQRRGWRLRGRSSVSPAAPAPPLWGLHRALGWESGGEVSVCFVLGLHTQWCGQGPFCSAQSQGSRLTRAPFPTCGHRQRGRQCDGRELTGLRFIGRCRASSLVSGQGSPSRPSLGL